MVSTRLLLPVLAGLGLAGCVAYSEPVGYVPPPGPVYVAPRPPPASYYYGRPGPPPRAYVRPGPRRVWVPRRCDRWGRCSGGYWR